MTVGGTVWLLLPWGVYLYDCGGSICMTVGGTVWLLLPWGTWGQGVDTLRMELGWWGWIQIHFG